MRIKKFASLALVLAALTLLMVSQAQAYPYIEVSGHVTPYASEVTDNGDGTSTLSEVLYSFTVITADAGAEMDFLSLEFQDEIFPSIGTISGLSPSDWSPSLFTSSSGSVYQLASAGTTLGQGESLTFSMLDIDIYNYALTDPSVWQEGQFWAQSFHAGDTYGGGDGGSTSLTPEPGTLLLLGSGLLGSGYFVRRRRRRNQHGG